MKKFMHGAQKNHESRIIDSPAGGSRLFERVPDRWQSLECGKILFVTKWIHGIWPGGMPGLPADGQHGNQDRGCCGEDEDPPAQAGAVSKSGQPTVHEVPAGGYSKEDPG